MNSPIVVHCLTSLDFGGVEKHMEILAMASGTGIMKHRFVAITGGGAAENALRDLGVQVDCLHERASIPSLSALISLYRFLATVRPSVVHTHGAEANFHGLLAARLAGVPVRIGEEIGIPKHSIRAKFVFKQVYRNAHRVIGISDSVSRWLISSGEVPANKVIRIYNPVLLPTSLSVTKKEPDIFRIGFVGRLEPVKNPMVLIDACAMLVAAGIPAELCIVGDGSQRRQLESRIVQLKIEHLVRLHGYQQNPSPFLLECNVYVQPSLSEGFGLALVEAMGLGLPVIATAVGGVPEIVISGRNGWLLDGVTADEVTRALKFAYMCGQKKLDDVGNEARLSVQERFVPTSYIQNLESIYTNLQDGHFHK